MSEEEKVNQEQEIEEKEKLPDPLMDKPEIAPPKKELPVLPIGGGVLAALLLLGFVYLLARGQPLIPPISPPRPPVEGFREEEKLEEGVDAATEALGRQGVSDEVAEIEKDIITTDFSTLDKELEEIEAELSGF